MSIAGISPFLFFPPAMPPTVSSAKLTLTVLSAGNLRRTAGRAYVLSVFDGFHILVALHPFLAAIQASYRANILGEITALYMDDLSVYQTIGNLLPCR